MKKLRTHTFWSWALAWWKEYGSTIALIFCLVALLHCAMED